MHACAPVQQLRGLVLSARMRAPAPDVDEDGVGGCVCAYTRCAHGPEHLHGALGGMQVPTAGQRRQQGTKAQ